MIGRFVIRKRVYLLTLVLIILSGCTQTSVTISPDDQVCEIDSDCVVIPYDCSCLAFTDAVNKDYVDKYSLNCDSYSGPVCNLARHSQNVSCVDNVCQINK